MGDRAIERSSMVDQLNQQRASWHFIPTNQAGSGPHDVLSAIAGSTINQIHPRGLPEFIWAANNTRKPLICILAFNR